MKRARVLFMVAGFMVTILLAYTLPAVATSPTGATVFFPYGNGATYSCTSGSPFVVDPGSPNGNCILQQIGPPPASLVCDVPVDITFVHDMNSKVENGRLCR